jgi:EAL domain-containing protein (putative c-di-GMP-specific phosphodiesterase class I)
VATETLLNDMRMVNEHRSVANHLKLEITESGVDNPRYSAYMLAALKQLGLGLAR